jgi:hypothetical protein
MSSVLFLGAIVLFLSGHPITGIAVAIPSVATAVVATGLGRLKRLRVEVLRFVRLLVEFRPPDLPQ